MHVLPNPVLFCPARAAHKADRRDGKWRQPPRPPLVRALVPERGEVQIMHDPLMRLSYELVPPRKDSTSLAAVLK